MQVEHWYLKIHRSFQDSAVIYALVNLRKYQILQFCIRKSLCSAMLDGRRNFPKHFTNAHHDKAMEARKHSSRKKNLNSGYFGAGSFLVLVLVTVSLILLPLLLPPLPPPPSLLLLVPLAILLMLVAVAFMTSDIRQVTSSYL